MKTNTAPQVRWIKTGLWLAALAGLNAATALAEPGNDNRAPEVPSESQWTPATRFTSTALGSACQIYTWNGTSWGSAVPDATLFDDEGNVVATHFASAVTRRGRVTAAAKWWEPCRHLSRVIVDSSAIPWLMLAAWLMKRKALASLPTRPSSSA